MVARRAEMKCPRAEGLERLSETMRCEEDSDQAIAWADLKLSFKGFWWDFFEGFPFLLLCLN